MAEIVWLNVVIDIPAEDFDAVGEFWAQATGTTMGDVHPEHDEFVHLLPASGDMHLELQRIDDGPAGVHLDLVVHDIAAVTDRAVSLGATVIARPGHAVLNTPGGVVFCIVPGGDESERAPVINQQHPHAADQISLDVPHEHFEADVEFWSALTGWPVNDPVLPEFRSFDQPPHLPIRLLVQQLGKSDTGGARSHLDISAGSHREDVASAHITAGSSIVERHEYWSALRDPGQMVYCVTNRQPEQGTGIDS